MTRDCVAVPGLGSVSPGIWEMRLMNVQSNISIANLRALLRQCPETEPFLQDMWRGKKRAGAQSRLPMLWGQCCGYLAPSLLQNVSLEWWQKGAGPAGGSQGGNPENSSTAQTLSQELPHGDNEKLPHDFTQRVTQRFLSHRTKHQYHRVL